MHILTDGETYEVRQDGATIGTFRVTTYGGRYHVEAWAGEHGDVHTLVHDYASHDKAWQVGLDYVKATFHNIG